MVYLLVRELGPLDLMNPILKAEGWVGWLFPMCRPAVPVVSLLSFPMCRLIVPDVSVPVPDVLKVGTRRRHSISN
jgi:hypothetical protein